MTATKFQICERDVRCISSLLDLKNCEATAGYICVWPARNGSDLLAERVRLFFIRLRNSRLFERLARG